MNHFWWIFWQSYRNLNTSLLHDTPSGKCILNDSARTANIRSITTLIGTHLTCQFWCSLRLFLNVYRVKSKPLKIAEPSIQHDSHISHLSFNITCIGRFHSKNCLECRSQTEQNLIRRTNIVNQSLCLKTTTLHVNRYDIDCHSSVILVWGNTILVN